MIIITYVSGHSSKIFHRLLEGNTQQEMDKLHKIHSADWGEVSRTLIPEPKAFEYMRKLFVDMIGGIYHIETHHDIYDSFKVSGVNISWGEIMVVGTDEEGEIKSIPASEIWIYWSKK